MKRSPRILPFVLAAAAFGAGPARSHAQPLQAPALVDEDLPPADAAPPSTPEPRAPEPRLPEPVVGGRSPAPAKVESAPPAREIQLVHSVYGDLVVALEERRRALRDGDLDRAKSAATRLLAIRSELGIDALDDLAMVEVRSALASLAGSADDAFRHAELAVAISPGLPAARFALARARFARDPAQAAAALADARDGVLKVVRDTGTARALLADVLAHALLGTAVAAALVVSLLLARHLRPLLHDVQHLPVVRHATPLQGAFFAIVVLALPAALGLGPTALVGTLALASAPYLSRRERAVATAALLAIALFPAAVERAARATAWTGTLAEDVELLERGADDGRVASRLEERAARGSLPRSAVVALARHYKRRGDLARAARLYETVLDRPDAIVNLGNVRFLQGDLGAARRAYLAALDHPGADPATVAAASYDLSKVYLREAALDRAQDARRRASQAAPEIVERYGSEADERANRWLIDVPLPAAQIESLADDGASSSLARAALRWCAGSLPVASWPWAPLLVALALWVVAAAKGWLRPSATCQRCGVPACSRCGPATPESCVQCVHAFSRTGLVDARDRLAKAAAVRRYDRWRRIVARVLSLAGAGHLWRGEPGRGALVVLFLTLLVTVVLFQNGPLPTPLPQPWASLVKIATCGPLAIAVWAAAVWDVFARTRRRRER